MFKTRNLPALLDGLKMWGLWILFTVFGLGLSSAFVIPIMVVFGTGDQGYYGPSNYTIVGVIIGAIIGIVVGGCHWLILRLRFHHKGRWLGATTIGWIVVSMTAFLMLSESSLISLSPSVIAISAGAIIGLSQWLALRGEVKRAIWWIPTTIAGWVCGLVVILFVTTLPVSQITALVAGGIVLGIVTGIGFVYLFDQSGQGALNAIVLSGLGLFVVLAAGLSMTWMYSQQRLNLRGHTGSVNSVAFSPDGKILASGSSDGTVKLWDVVSGQEISAFNGHIDEIGLGEVKTVAFSPDGQILAFEPYCYPVILRDVVSRKFLHQFDEGDCSLSITFSPDKRLFITGGGLDVPTVKVWNVANWQLVKTLYGQERSIESIAFSPDGRSLASGGSNVTGHGTVLILDFATGRELKNLLLPENQHSVKSVVFSPDGDMLVSISHEHFSDDVDGTVILWDVASEKKLHTLSSPGTSVVFSPDGNLLASGSSDGIVKFWDVVSGQLVKTLKGHTGGVNSVAFSPDGRLLASGSDDSTIKIWDISNIH